MESTALEGAKILFVEDDQFFADIMTLKLRGTGCEVNNVIDADQAFAALNASKPDVVILDIMLPGGVDGFTILEKVKSNPDLKHIPVVILSNLSRAEDVEKGMSLGAFKYLTKAHVTPKDVVESLESAISSNKV